MNVVITVDVFSSVLATTNTVIDATPIRRAGNAYATRLVIRETCIPNELSTCFESLFFVC